MLQFSGLGCIVRRLFVTQCKPNPSKVGTMGPLVWSLILAFWGSIEWALIFY